MWSLLLALALAAPAQCTCGPDCQCVPGLTCGCLPGYATTDLPSLSACCARGAKAKRLVVCWVGQRSPAGEAALPECSHCYARGIDLRDGPGVCLIDYRQGAPTGCTWFAGVGAPVDAIRRAAGLAAPRSAAPVVYYPPPMKPIMGYGGFGGGFGGGCGFGGCGGGG